MKYKRIPLGPLWTNCYVIDDGKGGALCVDPGGDPADVLSYLKKEGLKLELILLTHGHMDHILGVASLKKATGAEVYIPEEDGPMLTDPDLNLASEFDEEVEPVTPDRLLRDGDRFSVGEIAFLTIHTPGHTPGSCCFILEQPGEKMMVVGDTLFARSIGRTDLIGGDSSAMARSLERLKRLEGDMPVLPGHGPETTLERERQSNPFMN